jgi:PadR family transcriptional regulator, regulatory protein PadR
MGKPTDFVEGSWTLLILKTIALELTHGWVSPQRIRQVSKELLQVNQGALYAAPARSWAKRVDQGEVG